MGIRLDTRGRAETLHVGAGRREETVVSWLSLNESLLQWFATLGKRRYRQMASMQWLKLMADSRRGRCV